MNPIRKFKFTESFFAILVIAATAQHVNAAAWSLAHGLDRSWIGTVAIIIAATACFIRSWRTADSAEKTRFSSAWTWPAPWLFLGVMLWQIFVFPPTMNDSLCYRLPRIFLWLQDGFLSQTGGADGRMREMPWGWEMLALPFVAINQVKLVGLINLVSWVALLQLTHLWADQAGASRKNARWISLGIATAPVFLLQATSSANDLFAATALMVSVHFIISFRSDPQPSRIYLSLIPFMMACGVKPQFLVLGLGWGLWWLLGSGKPWKHTKIPALALAVPFALLVSPLPVFVLNYQDSGTIFGRELSSMVGGSVSPLLKIIAATFQFLVAQTQLPVMPGAEGISERIQSFSPFREIQSRIPQFEPGVGMIEIIDRASFGLVHFALICGGAALAFRTKDNLFRSLVAVAVLGFFIAAAKVVPNTIGRSFIGFIAIALPLTAWGLAASKSMWMKPACIAAALAGLLSMLLNPSSPAWPSRSLQAYASASGKTGLAEKLERYHAYQERAQTGVGFLAPVPQGEPVAALVRGFTPVVGLWTPDWRCHRIDFVHALDPGKFQESSHRWLLIGDRAIESVPGQVAAYRSLPGWRIISDKEFRPVLSQAPEKWTLYERLPD